MTDIFTTNFEKYTDTDMYDLLNEPSKQELPILLQYAQIEDQILELACGTGRLTIPFAEKGFTITGVDLHEGMLKKAQQKAQQSGLQIPFHLQDCTQLSLAKHFDLMFMVGNSFQHFLTNKSQDQLLHSVSSHLQKGGTFIFDTRNPILGELSKVDEYDVNFQDYRGFDIQEHHIETYEDATQILHCHTSRKIHDKGILIGEEEDKILLRYTYPLEMERLLHHHGLSIKECYGNWQGMPITSETPQMIYICERAK